MQREDNKRRWRNNQLARKDNERRYDETKRRQDDERVARREATQQPAGATRGQEGGAGHNERTRRGDATTSWRDKLMRGWRNERTARGNVTTSWHDKTTRGQRNERAARGDAKTSWRDKTTRGRRDKRRHNLVVFRASGPNRIDWQSGSHGHARFEHKPERLGVGDELQVVSNVVQKGVRVLSHRKDMQTKMAHPFVRVLRGPT